MNSLYPPSFNWSLQPIFQLSSEPLAHWEQLLCQKAHKWFGHKCLCHREDIINFRYFLIGLNIFLMLLNQNFDCACALLSYLDPLDLSLVFIFASELSRFEITNSCKQFLSSKFLGFTQKYSGNGRLYLLNTDRLWTIINQSNVSLHYELKLLATPQRNYKIDRLWLKKCQITHVAFNPEYDIVAIVKDEKKVFFFGFGNSIKQFGGLILHIYKLNYKHIVTNLSWSKNGTHFCIQESHYFRRKQVYNCRRQLKSESTLQFFKYFSVRQIIRQIKIKNPYKVYSSLNTSTLWLNDSDILIPIVQSNIAVKCIKKLTFINKTIQESNYIANIETQMTYYENKPVVSSNFKTVGSLIFVESIPNSLFIIAGCINNCPHTKIIEFDCVTLKIKSQIHVPGMILHATSNLSALVFIYSDEIFSNLVPTPILCTDPTQFHSCPFTGILEYEHYDKMYHYSMYDGQKIKHLYSDR